MRSIIPFNDHWLFVADNVDQRAPDKSFAPVTLPHANHLLPYHNFDNHEYQFISTYRKRFTAPEALDGRRLFVDFDGAMTAASVSLNGQILGEHDGGFVPFSFDLTDHVHRGENLLQVQLDSRERPDIPPYGNVVDYLTFGGIYRDVRLRYVEPLHIEDVFAQPYDVLTKPGLRVEVKVRNTTGRERSGYLRLLLRRSTDRSSTVIATSRNTDVLALGHSTLTATVQFPDLANVELWSPEHPTLYTLDVELYENEVLTDLVSTRMGFREAVFRDDGFYLNGEKRKLIGLNRHQLYPYIGAAAPARLQRKDADILKYELGVNIVRTSHYPQSPHFVERCDEIGLLVFEEIPGWQFIGDADWKALVLRDVEAMITRDRNYPCIVLWGVRVNESWDDEALYKATNALAHRLDPTRQTGGVRFFRESQFLEDVFTYNDFSNTVVEPVHTPYMVTEFNGHMFPTKTFDNEDRQLEHALRHARIQDKQMGMPNVAGAIGWCAFDYNTHIEFGSGDRICYHGVMDIFRLPKFAAYVYESQLPPSVRPVVRIASFWTPGDRSAGGNDPLYVFSNCDSIEVYTGGTLFGSFQPARDEFPHLPYAPFRVNGLNQPQFWGQKDRDLRVVGLVNGQPAAEHQITYDSLPVALVLRADDETLNADGSDMTRLVLQVTDRYGNRLPYALTVVTLTLDGPADLIGTNPFPLVGGQGALYVRAHTQPGTVVVRASAPRLPATEVKIAIQ